MPCRAAWGGDRYNYARVAFGAATQVWFGKYIDPTQGNYDKFYKLNDQGTIVPVDEGQMAADAFGEPDIWLARDSSAGNRFQDNQSSSGSLTDFTVVGASTAYPKDYKPGPFTST